MLANFQDAHVNAYLNYTDGWLEMACGFGLNGILCFITILVGGRWLVTEVD